MRKGKRGGKDKPCLGKHVGDGDGLEDESILSNEDGRIARKRCWVAADVNDALEVWSDLMQKVVDKVIAS